MKPEELRQWAGLLREMLKEFLPNRDALLWAFCFYGGVAGIIAAQFPEYVPDAWIPHMVKWGVASGLVGAKMGWSWAGTPKRVAGPGTMPGSPPKQTDPQQLENARTIAAAAGQPPPPPDDDTKGTPR